MQIDVFKAVQDHLAQEFRLAPESIQPDTTLEEIGADSLALVELLYELEQRLGFPIQGSPYEAKRVGDLVKFVEGVLAQRQAAATAA